MVENQHQLNPLAGIVIARIKLLRQLVIPGIPECHDIKSYFVKLPLEIQKVIRSIICPVEVGN